MAKGGAAPRYFPNIYSESDPKFLPLVHWLNNELQRISQAIDGGLAREADMLNEEPSKPFDGLIVGADGTNWNPGSGQGIYVYYASAWHKLG